MIGGKMPGVSAQVSVYPLRQEQLSPAITKVLDIFQEHGLDTNSGSMSTIISGSSETVFAALQAAFQSVAGQGQVVMVVTFSNACPLPEIRNGSQENSRAETASDLGDNNG
jgi:uncharacterized protein YqgV (UPF0045/DUF77 family)